MLPLIFFALSPGDDDDDDAADVKMILHTVRKIRMKALRESQTHTQTQIRRQRRRISAMIYNAHYDWMDCVVSR